MPSAAVFPPDFHCEGGEESRPILLALVSAEAADSRLLDVARPRKSAVDSTPTGAEGAEELSWVPSGSAAKIAVARIMTATTNVIERVDLDGMDAFASVLGAAEEPTTDGERCESRAPHCVR